MDKIKKILDISEEMQYHKHDSIFVICGQEGSSKSTLGLWSMDYLKAPISNVDLDKDDFITSLSDCGYCSDIMFDEAGDGLFSRDFASKLNKDIVKTFMVIRAKCLIVFLILPSFFALDVYFRRHRVRGLFYVYKRGKVAFYDKRKINEIIAKCEATQQITGVKPNFYDTFDKYEGKLLEPYLIKKDEKIKVTLERLKQGMNDKNEKANKNSKNRGLPYSAVRNVV